MSSVKPGSDPRRQPEPARYDAAAIALHWLIAILVLANLLLSLGFENLAGAERGSLIRIHKSIGVTILCLAAVRLAWRAAHRPPPPLASLRPSAKRLAAMVHWAFYGLLIVMPLSGWAMISADRAGRPTLIWGLVPWPRIPLFVDLPQPGRDQVHAAIGALHLGLGLALVVLVVMHVAGALTHQFVDHAPEFQRMAPKLRRRRSRSA